MHETVTQRLQSELDEIRSTGLYKEERVIESPQGAVIRTADRDVICLCANNYLGLSNDPGLEAAAVKAIETHGRLAAMYWRRSCKVTPLHGQCIRIRYYRRKGHRKKQKRIHFLARDRRMVKAARRHGPKIFIFDSSSSVYGINTKIPFSETDEINQPIAPMRPPSG